MKNSCGDGTKKSRRKGKKRVVHDAEVLSSIGIKRQYDEFALVAREFIKALNRFKSVCEKEANRRRGWISDKMSDQEIATLESEISRIRDIFPKQLYAQLTRWQRRAGL